MIVAGWILAIMSGWSLPYEILSEGLFWLRVNPWQDAIIAACFLLLGILPFLKPRQRRAEPSFLIPSRLGEVRMTEPAMKDIIIRSAQTLPSVRQVQPNLRQREEGLEVLVHAQVNPESVIPEIAEQLQSKIKEDMERYIGIKVVEVKVLVRNLEVARQSRAK